MILKDTNQQRDGKDARDKLYREGRRASMLSEYATLPKSPLVHQPKSSQNPIFFLFLWRIHYTDIID